MSTSASLLTRLRHAGDKPAWDRFVDLYAPLLARWAGQLTADASAADDLVQDVFLALLRKLPGFRYDPAESFRGWLRTLLLNRWRDRLRDADRRVKHEAAAARERPGETEPADFLSEAEYRRGLVARALELVRDEFRPATWAAFTGHGVEGRPAAEVGAEVGLTANAVYQATFRVLRRVRLELDGLIDLPPPQLPGA